MADTDQELLNEIRSFGQYRQDEISDGEIETAISRAKTDLQTQAELDTADWYEYPKLEDALFWAGMFFSKLINSSLDAKAVSAGGLSEEELLAKADGDITEWYRKYQNKKRILSTSSDALNSTTVTRSARTQTGGNRFYEQS